jgi:predicted RNA binding protein YcfA (HicA-like mRNA interferase family)
MRDEPEQEKQRPPKWLIDEPQGTNGAGKELFKGKLLSQKTAKKLLEQNGWEQTAGGKHVIKMKKSGQRPITLPRHKGQDYGKSLTARILDQAGLS